MRFLCTLWMWQWLCYSRQPFSFVSALDWGPYTTLLLPANGEALASPPIKARVKKVCPFIVMVVKLVESLTDSCMLI